MKTFRYMLCAAGLLALSTGDAQAASIFSKTICYPTFGKICLGKPCLFLSTKVYLDGDHVTQMTCDGATFFGKGTWTKYPKVTVTPPPPPPPTPCDPKVSLSCVDQPCTAPELGTSLMQLDQKNIIICLIKDDGSGYEWKGMVDDYQQGGLWASPSQFYEDTEGTWVGDKCPSGKIMTGTSTINVGMGGHNYWSLECK